MREQVIMEQCGKCCDNKTLVMYPNQGHQEVRGGLLGRVMFGLGLNLCGKGVKHCLTHWRSSCTRQSAEDRDAGKGSPSSAWLLRSHIPSETRHKCCEWSLQ